MSDPELAERLRRAVERLEILKSQSRGMMEPARLGGKIEGVKLAASYLEEGERIFGPYIDTDVRDPRANPCPHNRGVVVKFDGGKGSVLCERCRTILATGGVANG